MTPVAFLCFLICFAVLVSMFRARADALSPARVFGFVWSLTIGLADLKLSRLQHAWSAESWLVVLLGPLCFLAGRFAVWVVHLRVPLTPIRELRESWRESPVNGRYLFRAGVVLFLLFLVGYAAILLSGKEIPVFSARPGRARLAFQLFGLGLFLHNAVLIVLITVLAFLSGQVRLFRRGVLVGMSAVSVLLYGLTLQRFQIMMTVILCLALLYYTTRALRPGRIALLFSLAAVFFLLISTVRSGQLFVLYLYLNSQMTFDPRFAALTEPYMYFAMNVENFARAAGRLQEYSYGVFTLDFLGALSGLKHWLREYAGLVENPFLVSGYNTYSFFWTYYRDFGIVGLAGLSWVLGVGVGFLYHTMRARPSLRTMVWYAVAIFVMLFSFYLNPLTFLWFVYNLAVLAVILRGALPEASTVQERR